MRRRSEEGVSALFERFTERARQVVVLAQDEARALKHNYIGTEHILLGLLREEEALAARPREPRHHGRGGAGVVASIVGQGDEVTTGQIPFTPRAKKVSELALREALSLGHNYIGTEHILLGLVRENEVWRPASCSTSTLTQRRSATRSSACSLGPGRRGQSGSGAAQGERRRRAKLLDQFGRNLTKLAAEGKLDPVVGRQTEIERVMQILSRRTKNNPVLIGSPASARPPSSRASPPGSRRTRCPSS